jgi:hypothetical protein
MSRITELLGRVEKENPGLAADLIDEVEPTCPKAGTS